MVRDALSFKRTSFLEFELTVGDQFVEQLCVVYYLVVASEGGIFIFQRIETMWAGRHYFLYFIHIHRLNIVERHHLK